MIKSWIIYALSLALVLLLNIFASSKGMFILLCLWLILPLIAIIVNRLTRQDIDVKFELPDFAEKSAVTQGHMLITNHKRTLCPFCKVLITSENLLNGELNSFPLQFSLTPNGKRQIAFDISDNYCGKIVFKVSLAKCYDIFGLTYKKVLVTAVGKLHILPEILNDCAIGISKLSDNTNDNSYSADRAGYDLNEPYEYREYAVGDSPKSIHWKLSEKLDRLIVRQGGMPSQQACILILDTNIHADEFPSFDMLSKTAELYISVSKDFCDRDVAHMLCYFDHSKNELFAYTVGSEDDWFSVIPKLLSASFKQDSKTCLQHLSESTVTPTGQIICVSALNDENADNDIFTITPQDILQ